jgi:hypothetical protein
MYSIYKLIKLRCKIRSSLNSNISLKHRDSAHDGITNQNYSESLINKILKKGTVWWLIWYTLRVALSIATTQSILLLYFRLAKRTKRRIVAHCRLVDSSIARQTARCRATHCRDVALSHKLYDLSRETM